MTRAPAERRWLLPVLFATGLAIAMLMTWRMHVGIDALDLLTRGWLLTVKGVWVPLGNEAALKDFWTRLGDTRSVRFDPTLAHLFEVMDTAAKQLRVGHDDLLTGQAANTRGLHTDVLDHAPEHALHLVRRLRDRPPPRRL